MPEKELIDYLPLTLQLEAAGGIAVPLILRGTRLPAERMYTFAATVDIGTILDLDLWIGERPIATKNIKFGSLHFVGLPELGRGRQLSLTIRLNKSLKTQVVVRVDGSDVVFESQVADVALPPDVVALAIADAERNRIADKKDLALAEARNRAEAALEDAEQLLRVHSDAALSNGVAAVGLAIQKGNIPSITQRTDQLHSTIDKVRRRLPAHVNVEMLPGKP